MDPALDTVLDTWNSIPDMNGHRTGHLPDVTGHYRTGLDKPGTTGHPCRMRHGMAPWLSSGAVHWLCYHMLHVVQPGVHVLYSLAAKFASATLSPHAHFGGCPIPRCHARSPVVTGRYLPLSHCGLDAPRAAPSAMPCSNIKPVQSRRRVVACSVVHSTTRCTKITASPTTKPAQRRATGRQRTPTKGPPISSKSYHAT